MFDPVYLFQKLNMATLRQCRYPTTCGRSPKGQRRKNLRAAGWLIDVTLRFDCFPLAPAVNLASNTNPPRADRNGNVPWPSGAQEAGTPLARTRVPSPDSPAALSHWRSGEWRWIFLLVLRSVLSRVLQRSLRSHCSSIPLHFF